MMTNAFTVDLEDWFQGLTSTNAQPEKWPSYEARLEASAAQILALLDKYHVRATFFVLGHVADQYPGLIRRIDAAGHEIGVHGYWHDRIHRLTPEGFAAALDRAIAALEPLVSQPILGHRAPYFSINQSSLWALRVLQEKGFRYDSSFFPTRNMLYGYPQAPRFPCRLGNGSSLMEFPISTARWLGITWPIGGGFHVRALPYAAIRAGIRQLHRQGQPAVMYVHPWELDTGQRYRRVTFRERITHYHGRRGLTKKLERLFEEFAFCSLGELYDRCAGDCELWESPPGRRADPPGVKTGLPAQQKTTEPRSGDISSLTILETA
jgi:polysaccharide deacetylase family protein (PEP-CTERM system associated)